jgi:hypothetical protein
MASSGESGRAALLSGVIGGLGGMRVCVGRRFARSDQQLFFSLLFSELESGHVYMVPIVKETSSSSSNGATPPPGMSVHPTPVHPSSVGGLSVSAANGSTSAPSTPIPDKKEASKTLKGFNFKEAKEKMMRKKNKEGGGLSQAKVANRKSTSLAVSAEDMAMQRRRSSTNGAQMMSSEQLRPMLGSQENDQMSTSAGRLVGGEEAFPGVRQVTLTSGMEVKLEAIKDCMAAGPLSPDVREGDVLLCTRCDQEGNAEVLIRGQAHLVPLTCVQVVPMDNPTAEQKMLLAEVARRKSGGGAVTPASRRIATGGRKESVLGNLRSKMRGDKDESSSGPSSNLNSPKESSPVDEMQDEKLNPSSVFGKPLSANSTPIPGPVRKCVEFFRRNGNIKCEGIFRVPGSSNAVMRIRNRFLALQPAGTDLPDDTNPTVVASALKAFLFELPEPLIPAEHWYALMEVTDDRNFTLADAENLIDAVPSENVAVLHFLFDFLAEVSEYASENKMNPANLGMVFGIVLIRPPDNNVSNVGSSMPKEVCTFFVEHVDEIFNGDESASE